MRDHDTHFRLLESAANSVREESPGVHTLKVIAAAAILIAPVSLASQQRITRAQAIESALARGGRLAIAAADTSVARAGLLAARLLQDPALAASYSKSTPKLHFSLELPIDLPGVRSARIGSASAAVRASEYRYQFERAAAALDADTTYTRALAAAAHARLSRRNALVADTLLQMTIVRRDAGDASDLEVELAKVNAGQEHNLATADSVDLTSALIDLQAAMGVITPEPTIIPADTLTFPDSTTYASSGTPLQIAAGLQSIVSAERNVQAQHRSIFGSPALMGGFETRDPGGTGNEILPTFGVTIPIPLFNRNRGGIAQAKAELNRAHAELTVTRLQYATTLLRMERQRGTAYSRASRDRVLLASANRVAQMSITAYREGAFSLSNVFEAQRSARDVLRQYVDDLADAWIADAALRVLTLTAPR
jgi:outer membrane protein, heavy metal efflux system